MPFVILPTNSISGGYDITNSARFNVASTDFLIRTIGSTGSNQIWTASGWTKRQQLGASSSLYCSSDSSAGNNFRSLFINASDQVQCAFIDGTYTFQVETNALLRDVSAWYHIVASVDTTQATASNRVKIWINGVLQTSFATASYPSQNATINFSSSGYKQLIASLRDSSTILNGCYLAEMHILDGVAKQASDFGETDEDTGIWKPKAYTGTYGTNGFYLQFKNSASLGTDSSGNGNTFTVNNLTSIDQTTDTPTNNFATINTLTCNDTGTLTSADGNLTITGGNDMGATFGITKGKWYWESKKSNTGTVAHWGIGFTNSWSSATQIVTGNGSGYRFRDDFSGGLTVSNSGSNGFTDISTSSTGSSVANGDIIGVALDLDSATKSVTFYQNGSSVASATFSYDGTSSTCFPFVRNNSGASSQWNFGNPPYSANSYTDGAGYGNFSYAVPSGYYALNTKNLAQFG